MWIPKWVERIVLAKQKEQSNESALKLEILGKNNDIRTLREQVQNLQAVLKRYQAREFIDFAIGDPVPTDVEKRRAYVGAVAGLYHDILHPKLKHMIAVSRAVLENPENTEKQDEQIKGTIYALFELIRWGNLMVGEDKANMAGQNPSSPKDAEQK